MASEVTDLKLACLICNAPVIVEDGQNKNQFISENDKKNLDLFLLKILFEISESVIFVEEKGNKHEHWEWLIKSNWKYLQTCDKCGETIKQASVIYNEIKEQALQFRGIQKQVVQRFKECSVNRIDNEDKPGIVEQFRGIVEDCMIVIQEIN